MLICPALTMTNRQPHAPTTIFALSGSTRAHIAVVSNAIYYNNRHVLWCACIRSGNALGIMMPCWWRNINIALGCITGCVCDNKRSSLCQQQPSAAPVAYFILQEMDERNELRRI